MQFSAFSAALRALRDTQSTSYGCAGESEDAEHVHALAAEAGREERDDGHSGSATLTMLESSTAIMEPVITVPATTHLVGELLFTVSHRSLARGGAMPGVTST